MTYSVNEIFHSVQGEGGRAGEASVFVRFAGCNLTCSLDGPEGFDCDTDFSGGRRLSASDLVLEMRQALGHDWQSPWCVLTGGEPLLQLDQDLSDALFADGWKVAVETNGTTPVPDGVGIDWLSVSPKTAEHSLRVGDRRIDELRYVRAAGQTLPKPRLDADRYYLSPAWESHGLPGANLEHCIALVKENPRWRLSVQQHKIWRVR